MDESTDVYWIDARIEEIGQHVIQRAFDRAAEAYDLPEEFEEIPDGFHDKFNQELALLVAQDDLEKLEADEVIVASGVAENGYLEYTEVA